MGTPTAFGWMASSERTGADTINAAARASVRKVIRAGTRLDDKTTSLVKPEKHLKSSSYSTSAALRLSALTSLSTRSRSASSTGLTMW